MPGVELPHPPKSKNVVSELSGMVVENVYLASTSDMEYEPLGSTNFISIGYSPSWCTISDTPICMYCVSADLISPFTSLNGLESKSVLIILAQ